ncbi:MAG: dihydroorotate dehydrogenase electron transfer subunit, partial [Thermoplasmata archaeon]
MNYERIKIDKKIKENENIYTLLFKYEKDVYPGQFGMIWIPGIDEIPMSFSFVNEIKGITFKVIGNGTKSLSLL